MSRPLDALELDRALWPDRDHLPARCEVGTCGAPADPRAVALTAYACPDHLPADVLEEVTA